MQVFRRRTDYRVRRASPVWAYAATAVGRTGTFSTQGPMGLPFQRYSFTAKDAASGGGWSPWMMSNSTIVGGGVT